MTRSGSSPSKTQIADLRASLRAVSQKAEVQKPPKPKKQAKAETIDQRAEKAERQAMLQHTTSLLKDGNSKKPYVRIGERAEKKSGGFLFQLIVVMGVAGGVAYALDPSLVPQEWQHKVRAFIAQWI